MDVEMEPTKGETPKDNKETPSEAKTEEQEKKSVEDEEMKQILADIEKLTNEELIARTNEYGFEMRTHKSNLRSIRSRMNEKLAMIRTNNEKIARGKQLPFLVGHVVELLDPEDEEEDLGSAMIKATTTKPKAAVVKTTMRTTHYLPEVGLVPSEKLHPGDLVALNPDTNLILEELPTDYDGRAKAMELDERPTEKYSDIGGLDKQILEMVEAVVLPMTHAEKFKNIGIKPPKGVLLYGPPGTGKTLLARACAAQTKATFLKLSATSLIQTYIGEGAKIVRDAFQLAKDKGPSIVFIDEIDAVGGKRSSSEKSGDREVQRTLLELLNQLDGFSSADNVKVIAATNRVDILDPALLRSGRIDRKIELPNPNEESRAKILQIHSRKMNVGPTVNFEELSRSTNDFNGAQLKAVCVEAGMIALRRDATELSHEDFMEGIAEVQAKKKKSLSYYA